MSGARGCYAVLAAAVKRDVSVPVMAVGRINTPEVADTMLANGDADFVCLSRALVADPYFVAKAQSGDVEAIVPCIACNECVASVHRHRGIACTMNPMASRELEFQEMMRQKPVSRRVVVIGAGVAGMAATLTAARRGHETHLIERSRELGGQLLLAHRPPHREELENALHYFRRRIVHEGVKVHLGRDWGAEKVAALSPNHVIVSTGADSRLPDIPGINQPHVIFGWQVIAETRKAGKTCVVVGGGLVGIEVADFLAHRGHKVMIVARSGLLTKAVWADHVYFLDRVRELGIETMANTKVHAIGPDWIDVEPAGQIQRILKNIDNVIICTGYEPRQAIGKDLMAKGIAVTFAGDVLGSRKFFQAVEEGTLAGLGVQGKRII